MPPAIDGQMGANKIAGTIQLDNTGYLSHWRVVRSASPATSLARDVQKEGIPFPRGNSALMLPVSPVGRPCLSRLADFRLPR